MALAWFRENWFSLTQSLGIICSLVFTSLTLRRDILARRRTDDQALTQQHRELWSEVHRRPELARVVKMEADLVAQPVTVVEEEFLNLVFVHFQTSWSRAREGSVLKLRVLENDASHFFNLPIPNWVWRRTRSRYAPEFASFVDHALTTK